MNETSTHSYVRKITGLECGRERKEQLLGMLGVGWESGKGTGFSSLPVSVTRLRPNTTLCET